MRRRRLPTQPKLPLQDGIMRQIWHIRYGFEFKSDFTSCVWRISSSNQSSDQRLFHSLSFALGFVFEIVLFDQNEDSMGRKRLCITSTDFNDHVEEHVEDHETSETQGQSNFQECLSTNEQGAPKKVRGYTQKAETWKMNSTQRIVVTFNKFEKPVGDEGNELVQYLGTLVRMADHVSIEYSDWRKVPMQKKEDMYSLVKSKFIIHPDETSEIKKMDFHSMVKKWRTWKSSLKARGYDPSLTIDEIVAQQTNNDNRVNLTQFKELVTHWFTTEFQSTCAAKRSSRSKMKEPHVTGTKSFARVAHELATKNNDVYPTRAEMYITTRTRKDGSVVDDKLLKLRLH
ncbi:hypothetical protein L1987_42921 [Smallanthus sonchifolius]|uniref:Uncharacterized protein n=1 Tax=Smallanthus sonchifolius TaxID=185202 RepID=A0ACB9GJZ2_9ASTR|nr:hypothetical protein L1987_42921 [Smallanthus sonchifolius]